MDSLVPPNGLNLGPVRHWDWNPTLVLQAMRIVEQYSADIEQPTDGDLRFAIKTPDRTFRAQLIVHELERLARFYVYPDSLFFPFQAQQVAELVGHVSHAIVVGSFEWDAMAPAVHYRHSAYLSEGAEEHQLSQLMNSAVFPLRIWTRAFSLFSENGLNPREACAIALLEEGIGTVDGLSKSAMKHVLKLEK